MHATRPIVPQEAAVWYSNAAMPTAELAALSVEIMEDTGCDLETAVSKAFDLLPELQQYAADWDAGIRAFRDTAAR